MLELRRTDEGHLAVPVAQRADFAECLHKSMRDDVLGSSDYIGDCEGEKIMFALPPPNQLLDFVKIEEGASKNTLLITLKVPAAASRDKLYHVFSVTFETTPA